MNLYRYNFFFSVGAINFANVWSSLIQNWATREFSTRTFPGFVNPTPIAITPEIVQPKRNPNIPPTILSTNPSFINMRIRRNTTLRRLISTATMKNINMKLIARARAGFVIGRIVASAVYVLVAIMTPSTIPAMPNRA